MELWYSFFMATPLSEAAENALSSFRHHQALALQHSKRADGFLDQFLSLISYEGAKSDTPAKLPRCVREWTAWLHANGPAFRRDIYEGTGVKFNERGTPHTIQWSGKLNDVDDDSISPNTIVRFIGRSPTSRRGSPPTIYALWSQRYEVRPKFGVGPERPTEDETAIADEHLARGEVRSAAEILKPPETMLGVIQPPDGTVSMTEVRDANGWPQQAWDFYGQAGDAQSNEPEDGTADG